MPRLFCAIAIPSSPAEQIADICYGLSGARWCSLTQLHLTLCFLGTVPDAQVVGVLEALDTVATPGFELSCTGVGFFPPRKPVRTLWIGCSPCAPLSSLQRSIALALRRGGIAIDGRRFHPHITIARFRHPPPPELIAPYLGANALFSPPPFWVDRFHLFSSRLTPQGPAYTCEETFRLDSPDNESDDAPRTHQ